MAKPILVIRNDKMGDDPERIHKDLLENFNHEYHIFLVINPGYSEIKFEVYNSDKAEDIDIEKLKKIVNGNTDC